MKFTQYKTLGATAALALLLAAGNVSAGKPQENGADNNSPNNGECCGASVAVSNLCEVVGDNLVVHTTITDKSSGETSPVFEAVQIQPQYKIRKNLYPLGGIVDANVDIAALNVAGAADPDTGQFETITTTIDLCAAGLPMEATSVNASLRVQVFNSNNTYNSSKCSEMTEGGLKIGGMALCQ